MRNEHIRVQTVQLSPSAKWSAVVITFRYPDRPAAQRVRRQLVTQLIQARGNPAQRYWTPPATRRRQAILDRLQIAVLGTIAGILLGLAASRFRRTKLATA